MFSRCLLLVLTLLPSVLHAAPEEFTWQNPLPIGTSGIDGLRDPFILREGGTWYMTGTGKPFFTLDYAKLGLPGGVPAVFVVRPEDVEVRGHDPAARRGRVVPRHFWAPKSTPRTPRRAAGST